MARKCGTARSRGRLDLPGETGYNYKEMTTAKTKELKPGKVSLSSVWKEVARKQKPLMVAMVVLLIASVILLVFSLTTLRPQNTVVIVGYGDVYGEISGISGGYRRDSWMNMLAFPVLALIYGLVHNVMILKLYRKYGRDAAMMVAVASILLVVGTFVVIFRLLGEW